MSEVAKLCCLCGKSATEGGGEAGAPLAACRQVFEYRPAYIGPKRLHLYTLMFWQAFMFCMAFEDPDAVSYNASDD